MKILVLSDSHSGLSFMRMCMLRVKPDAVVHLGDYFEDAEVLSEENPQTVIHRVPGNCDRYRCPPGAREVLAYPVCGVKLYMTHGHRHGVKLGREKLLADGRAMGVDAVLYGHTHIPDCHMEADGMWVLNPGTCATHSGTAGLILVENGKITECRILRLSDLEDTL